MRCCHCKYCKQVDFEQHYCSIENYYCDEFTRCNRFVFKTLFWCIVDIVKLIKARKLHKEWLG